MDHVFLAHDMTKDSKHPTLVSNQTNEARQQCKEHVLDVRH